MPRRPQPDHAYIGLYRRFADSVRTDPLTDEPARLLGDLTRSCVAHLVTAERRGLESRVPGKEYFAFTTGTKLTRPVNADLFLPTDDGVDTFLSSVLRGDLPALPAEEITRACYTIAMSFCCTIDLTKEGDQKTPGTFFERFISYLYARTLGVKPATGIEVLNLGLRATLPTDFIFDPGPDRPKFHLPVKTSTRERVIQVWAHQRVLDGIYGMGRFLGTLVCLTETKLDHTTREVVEICLPDQWRLYQMFIAQMKRIYYLDMPRRYAESGRGWPRIPVKPFGEFFSEVRTLGEEI